MMLFCVSALILSWTPVAAGWSVELVCVVIPGPFNATHSELPAWDFAVDKSARLCTLFSL